MGSELGDSEDCAEGCELGTGSVLGVGTGCWDECVIGSGLGGVGLGCDGCSDEAAVEDSLGEWADSLVGAGTG